MNSIDALYAGFVSSLPADLQPVARDLPFVLRLSPASGQPWSAVFSHAVTLEAPRLFSVALAAEPEAVRRAVLAHALSVIEAFACGTPVIVRDSGGSREAVDRTGGGIVYQSRAELRAAILALAANPELQGHLAERARAGYARHYSRERYLRDYLDVVAELDLAKRSGQPEPGRRSHAS